MRYAILGDIHGNLEALEAVLAVIRGENIDKTELERFASTLEKAVTAAIGADNTMPLILLGVGALSLLGAPLLGRFEGRYAGHGINNALVRAVLARPQAWRWSTLAEAYAQAV